MVRRSRDDESVAVLDAPAMPVRSPAEIAKAAGEQTLRLRLDSCAANIRRWREIVTAVAEGQEPDGEKLAEIARIADELRLPADALAICVETITTEQRLQRQVEESERRADAALKRSQALADELDAARKRVQELEREAVAAQSTQINWANTNNVLNDHHTRHPLMYAEPGDVAAKVIAQFSSNGIGTLKPQGGVR